MTVQGTLLLNQGNDETVSLALTQASGAAFNLTGSTVNFYIKPSALTPDSAATVIKLSTTTGEVVVTDQLGGLATVTIPASDLKIPVGRFWRCDVVQGSTTKTALFGQVQVGYR